MTNQEILKIFNERCRKGDHPLDWIYRHGSEMEEKVVRWCHICGMVVIDIDYDGRTKKGTAYWPKIYKIAKEIPEKKK